jgi:putative tryptophan/tyrosine transport system substrate-binding protein
MRRRDFLVATVTLWPLNGLAQTPPKRPLIGFLSAGSKATGGRYYSGFPLGMRELGYVEGRDYVFEDRYAEGDLDRLPLLAAELVQLNPDVVVAGSISVALVVKKASITIPVVAASLIDPVGFGLVASHARPGGNVTGILSSLETLPGKQLELARELMPAASSIGILINLSNANGAVVRRDTETAAATLGVKLVVAEVRIPADLEAAFRALQDARVELAFVPPDAMFLSERRRVAALAFAARLPTMCARRELVEEGALMSYGINLRENFRRAAFYVDRILQGAKPGDLPVELPTKLELVVNLKTARALGITIPESFLVRADEVIE